MSRQLKSNLSVPLFSQNGHSSTKEPIALPATPQQRRQQLQTYQVAKKKMSIEQYLRETDPYVCSTANPGFPVPLVLYELDHSLAKEDLGLRRLILNCLTDHQITPIISIFTTHQSRAIPMVATSRFQP